MMQMLEVLRPHELIKTLDLTPDVRGTFLVRYHWMIKWGVFAPLGQKGENLAIVYVILSMQSKGRQERNEAERSLEELPTSVRVR
jgi:hypothetical protein